MTTTTNKKLSHAMCPMVTYLMHSSDYRMVSAFHRLTVIVQLCKLETMGSNESASLHGDEKNFVCRRSAGSPTSPKLVLLRLSYPRPQASFALSNLFLPAFLLFVCGSDKLLTGCFINKLKNSYNIFILYFHESHNFILLKSIMFLKIIFETLKKYYLCEWFFFFACIYLYTTCAVPVEARRGRCIP